MRYALIGHPLGHSLSPRLHQLLARASGREIEYTLIDIPPEALCARLPELLRTHAGLNVTIPHKQAVIPLLSRLDESAARFECRHPSIRPVTSFPFTRQEAGFSESPVMRMRSPRSA